MLIRLRGRGTSGSEGCGGCNCGSTDGCSSIGWSGTGWKLGFSFPFQHQALHWALPHLEVSRHALAHRHLLAVRHEKILVRCACEARPHEHAHVTQVTDTRVVNTGGDHTSLVEEYRCEALKCGSGAE